MRVTSKGQVTIPIEIRHRFGFLPDTEVEFVVEDDTVSIVRLEPTKFGRGSRIVEQLRGGAKSGWTTDEILALTRDPIE